MTVLVIAEHEGGAISLSTRRAIGAAAQLAADIHVLVAEEGASAACSAAAIGGVAKVLHADAAHYREALAEDIAPLIARAGAGYSHIVAASTTTGRDILPRAAALMDAPMLSDVTAILGADTFQRPIYAGNAYETVQCAHQPLLLTVRVTAFPAPGEGGQAVIERVTPLPPSGLSSFVSRERASGGRPDLAAARVVISGGRGLGSAENFQRLNALADRLGAAIGASRAAVDAGFAPNELQVGQTGRVVAPELYIAIGISGAIQHLAGMKESRVIVAINKDANAPIFALADYGLMEDALTALAKLEEALTE